MTQIPMLPQFYVGRGVDSMSGRGFGQAIDFDPEQAVDSGITSTLVLESITSSRDLTQKLDIGANVSYTDPGWSVAAEFKLMRPSEVNSYYVYALVRAIFVNPPLVIRNPRLRPEARELLVQRGWDAFAAAYGWEHVEGKITGGSYYGLLEIQTTNETQQLEVKVKLSGHYGNFKGDGSVDVALKEIAKTTAINAFVMRSGGDADPLEVTFEAMLEQARNFAREAEARPVTIAVITADYRTNVPLPAGLPTPDALPRARQRDVLSELGQEYLRLRDYKASVQFVLDHFPEFDEFRGLDAAGLAAKRAEYQASLEATGTEIDKIVQHAARCAADFNMCQTYTRAVHPLPLPTIGGQLMNLKQMEEKLAVFEQELTNLRRGTRHFENIYVDGQITQGGGSQFYSTGRMHIHGEELLYLVNKGGIIVGKGWAGGNGNLLVEGNLQLNGNMTLAAAQQLYSPGRMHINGEEILYLLNKGGTVVSNAWGGNGNLTVDGNIGTAGQSPTPRTAGWDGGIHTWDVEAEGTMWSHHGYESGPRDLAENYGSVVALEPGDVVGLDHETDRVVLSAEANALTVVGVVSTAPGVLLNATRGEGAEKLYPIALCGRVPCKVVNENGPIQRGDLLTSSSTPGHAMKANPVLINGEAIYRPGTIIGKAFESLETATGVIEIVVASS